MMRGMESSLRVLILGASSGIGEALARHLAAQGCHLGLAARRMERLQALQKELPGACIHYLDLAQPDEARQNFERLASQLGGLDILIANAAIDKSPSLPEWKAEQDLIRINVAGTIAVIDAAVEIFQRQNSGHIVGVTSIVAVRGNGRNPAYSASKAFLVNYLEGLRQRLPATIRVTDIAPGFVDTRMIEDRKRSGKAFWVASPDTVAKQIWQAIQKGKRKVYVTRRWKLIACLLQWMPGPLLDRLFRRHVLPRSSKVTGT